MPTAIQKIEPEDDGTGSGIVSSTMDKVTDTSVDTQDGAVPIPKVEEYGAVKPAEAVIDPGMETVEGRLGALTSGESRYVNLARSGAQRAAAKRGMINTAMAAGLGEEAAIREALPIAQQDAKTYADRAMLAQTQADKFGLAEQESGLEMRETKYATDVGTEAQKEINRQNATLNMEIDAFKSTLSMNEETWSKELQTKMELTLANEKLSNDMKIQYVQAINGIMADTQTQISEVGLSDRTPEAQAAAIFRLEENRNASIKVYEDLLASSDDWEWSTEFTPEAVTTIAERNNYWNAPGGEKPINEPEVGDRIGNKTYAGNGVWEAIVRDYGD